MTTCTNAEALERQAKPGWLMPYLIRLDVAEIDLGKDDAVPGKPKGMAYTYRGPRRWDYWLKCCYYRTILREPIPPLHFQAEPDPVDARAVQDILRLLVQKGYGWTDAWMSLVAWILWGLNGAQGAHDSIERELERIPADVQADWYRQFNLGNLLHSPCDWGAYVLQHGLPAERGKTFNQYQGNGFFSTPLPVVKMMSDMIYCGEPTHASKFDTVMEPCAGTGSMLLEASNRSLRLYGQEISYDLWLNCILNGYLFMPWLVYMPAYMQAVFEKENPRAAANRMRDSIFDVAALREKARQGQLVQMEMF